jgi:1,4-dihydroxy-2-naphthoyl-CoA synthase
MRRRCSPALAIFAALAPTSARAACDDDLAANDVRFKQTIQRLDAAKTGAQAEQCAAYRSHVQIMQRGREIFARCTTGLAQRENVGQMNDSIADFQSLIKRRCGR